VIGHGWTALGGAGPEGPWRRHGLRRSCAQLQADGRMTLQPRQQQLHQIAMAQDPAQGSVAAGGGIR